MKPRKKSPSKLAHELARRKRYRKKKAAIKAASRQREQTSRDSGRGEGAGIFSTSNRAICHCADNGLKGVETQNLSLMY